METEQGSCAGGGPHESGPKKRLPARVIASRDGIVVFGPTCMKPGDAAIVIERVHAELEAHSRG